MQNKRTHEATPKKTVAHSPTSKPPPPPEKNISSFITHYLLTQTWLQHKDINIPFLLFQSALHQGVWKCQL